MKKPVDILIWFFLLFYVFSGFSCAGKSYPFIIHDNNQIRLKSVVSGNSIQYRFNKKSFKHNSSEPLYISALLSVHGEGYVFIIETSGASNVVIPVIFDKGNNAAVYYSLPAGVGLEGFTIRPAGETDESLSMEKPSLLSINIEDNSDSNRVFSGFRRGAGFIYYSHNTSVYSDKKGDLSFRFDIYQEISGITVQLGDNNEILFSFFPETALSGKYLIAKTVNNEITVFPPDFENFRSIKGVEIHLPGMGIDDVKRISIDHESVQKRKSSLAPLKADFGTILERSMDKWRFSNYELYSWSLYPDILIIDTANLVFQNLMFKRLVYYVEKPLTAGTLVSNSELRKNNSWNAHDYGAEDLASFFNSAREEDFRLNTEEDLLKAILLDNNVIIYEENRYKPVKGGILAVSQVSRPELRSLLLRHEGYHGIYYSSEEFKERCMQIWDSTDDRIRFFWKLLLKNKTYDEENITLLVKEFKAYSLQQPLEDAEHYFFNIVLPSLYRAYPEERDVLDTIKNELKNEFLDNCRKLDHALFELTGFRAGNLVFITVKEPEAENY